MAGSFKYCAREVRNPHREIFFRYGALWGCMSFVAGIDHYAARFPIHPFHDYDETVLLETMKAVEKDHNELRYRMEAFERKRIRAKMNGKRQMSRRDREELIELSHRWSSNSLPVRYFVMQSPTLSNKTLTEIPAHVARPAYDRTKLKPSIVHIGVGAFHRSHMETYLDDLAGMGEKGETEWGVVGVGLLSHDGQLVERMGIHQDNLYTVVTRSAETTELRVIGTLIETLWAVKQTRTILERMTSPQTKIVSLTITEGGYAFDPETGNLQTDLSAIAHDLQNLGQPQSVYGFLVEALRQRKEAGVTPFTVLSCDNLQHNGDMARKMTLQFAEKVSPELAYWIAEFVTFPNSMVDRITPSTTDELRRLVWERGGYSDAVPVGCEPFRQWVIEDNFCNGRPPLERVGVTFTDNVTPYETVKIRMLNAGHSAIGYLGAGAGYEFIHEIMADTLFSEFLTRLMTEEIAPMLTAPPGMELEEYGRNVRERFANPVLKDGTARICGDASNKIPKFLLPTLRERLSQNLPTPLLSLALAGWFHALHGKTDKGDPLTIADPMSALLEKTAKSGGNDPTLLLKLPIFGDLAHSETLISELRRWLTLLQTRGIIETLRSLQKE